MRTRTTLLALLALLVAPAAGCGSDFRFEEPSRLPPLRGSAVAVTGGAEIWWSPVEGADGYRVLLDPNPGNIEEWVEVGLVAHEEEASSAPLTVLGLTTGERHYVGIVPMYGAEVGEMSTLLRVEPLRVSHPVPRGLAVDAGYVLSVASDTESYQGLRGPSWQEPEGNPEQYCELHWDYGDIEDGVDPCTVQDVENVGVAWAEPGVFQPILFVEDVQSGRTGESFTTVFVR